MLTRSFRARCVGTLSDLQRFVMARLYRDTKGEQST